jgi:alkaline phosphatase
MIVMIGDGMGFEQVAAAGMYLNGSEGTLCFEGFEHQGQVETYSADSWVTDSAAAATAIATGYKVNNGVISMGYPGGGEELKTLLEYYKEYGKSTGLVTTTYMTHATPAAFGAHERSRSYKSNIARDYLQQTRPNILFGGGRNGMSISSAVSAGYTVVTDAAGLYGLDVNSETMVSGQFGNSSLPYEYDGLGSLPHLSEMTAVALEILDNDPDGFFLMVEGGRIDHAGHSHHIRRNVHETIEFGNAVQEVIDWASGRDDTLIVVTADHETGGLRVIRNNGAGNYPSVSWSTGSHTGVNVPVYAWGVNADLVSGVIDNTEIFEIAMSLLPMPIEIAMHFTPKVLNVDSQGRWLKAHFVLPEDISVEEVDTNTPATIQPLGIESDYINVFVDKGRFGESGIEIGFDRASLCGAGIDYGAAEVKVVGRLKSGEYFCGTDTIRIQANNLRYLGEFCSYWLAEGCGVPDWCGGADVDKSTAVDFVDFAMFDGCCIEVVED